MVDMDKLKKIVFFLAIVIVYLPMIKLGINTFVPNDNQFYYTKPGDDCYAKVPATTDCSKYDPLSSEFDACKQKLDNLSNERNECFEKQQEQARLDQEKFKEKETLRFIISAIISFITLLLVYFIAMNDIVNYGLFAGAVVNILLSFTYNVDKSYVGFATLLLVFILTLAFINKMLKKKN